MASKKRKLTFTDLADDDFVQKQNELIVESKQLSNQNINFTLNDLKNPQANNQDFTQQRIEVKSNETINSTATEKILDNQENTTNLVDDTNNPKQVKANYGDVAPIDTQPSNLVNNEVVSSSQKPTKKVYEVNYDDILNDSKEVSDDSKKILDNLVEKKDPIKELFSSKNDENNSDTTTSENQETEEKVYKNLRPRSTVKTYNEAIKVQEKNAAGTHFEENKIKQFLSVKEKLDVKTNIYLKNSIVIKLNELEQRTNESRSSIINKLIEIALKTIEE